MPPSQLKQLKASLRENGVLGPQKSKKQRKATGKDSQKRSQRNAALESIRERFNPFEVKTSARPQKYDVISNKEVKAPVGRPGVTRGLGEERRRETLLKELQSRNKVGGLLDRRFGENDPTLTPEQKAAERFARQNERKLRKSSMFNLEDEEEMGLTHGGRSLDFGDEVKDDYEQDEIDRNDVQDFDDQDDRPKKRVRLDDDHDDDEVDEEDMVERRKTKNEVMKEIIAKSKLYKAERQAAKADDDDLRMELDQGMSEMYDILRSHKPPERTLPTPPSDSDPHMDPARAAMLAGKSREDAEKEYEANVRQMRLDARSKPALRTKTEEEKATEEAERLQELERKRVRRMKGEEESSDEEDGVEPGPDEDVERDDAEDFGLNQPGVQAPRPPLDVEDEDEFVLDDDLIASGSEVEMASDDESVVDNSEQEDDGDDDFINGLVLPAQPQVSQSSKKQTLAFTYSCPQTHDELLELLRNHSLSDLPTIVQRIRALYHKGLAEQNDEKLGTFAHALVQHIAYIVDEIDVPNFNVVEGLIRHIHSMAKSQPHEVASAFRSHLTKISDTRPLGLTAGDLMVLTSISSIFPTSDHFHPVATPAMLTIARYLGQSQVQTLQDLGIGTYCCSLALQYQRLAKRYVPEVVTYLVNGYAILSPTPLKETTSPWTGFDKAQPLNVPIRLPSNSLRIRKTSKSQPTETNYPRKLSFAHLLHTSTPPSTFPVTLLHNLLTLTRTTCSLYAHLTAYSSLISPLIHALTHLSSPAHHLPPTLKDHITSTLTLLTTTVSSSLTTRAPLLLHSHRPLPIKSCLPSFIENYNPTAHYDPDLQRQQLSRLRAEHRKEKKGAMRELRKDSQFVAREMLREKKERDEGYEKKMRRLVSEIGAEAGGGGEGRGEKKESGRGGRSRGARGRGK